MIDEAMVQARKRVAAMRAEGAQMREQLLTGASIQQVAGFDLSLYEDKVEKITKIQATVRGHLERKKLKGLKTPRRTTVCCIAC
jgi:hypothetical protein